MPYTQEFHTQENKWFSVLLMIILPFYAFFKIISGALPSIKDVGPPKK